MKTFEEIIESVKLPERNTSSKIMSARELVDTIGKTRAKAVFNHPWHKKYMNYSHSPNVYKVHVDGLGYPQVSGSNAFTFNHKGKKIRRMVRFDLNRKHQVMNAHLFHNYDDQRHSPEHGGGPLWNWEESHKKDVEESVELHEMGDSAQGQEKLKAYIKQRAKDIASSAIEDAVHAATQLKSNSRTVIGLDKDGNAIYRKERQHFNTGKKITGIERAVNRLK